jgi:hypothetical protein
MSTETKRRLLLSKWNGFDRVGDMREQLDAKDETIGDLNWQIEQLESVLGRREILDARRAVPPFVAAVAQGRGRA